MFSRKFFPIFILAVLILLVFLALIVFSDSVKSGFFKVAKPVFGLLNSAVSRLFSDGKAVFNFKKMQQENNNLKNEIALLSSQTIRIAELERENNFLRKELPVLNAKKEVRFLSAKIVSFDYFSLANSIIIDVGREDGAAPNMPVIISPNILIGKISKTEKSFSFVRLIFHPQNKVSAITEKTSADGLVSGSFGYNLFMDMISKEKNIKEGEIVFSSGLDGIFPRGLNLGKISSFKTSDDSLFNKAAVDPAFDAQKLRDVLVIENYLEKD